MRDTTQTERQEMPHALKLDDRKLAAITGVTAVDCFNEQMVSLATTQGGMTILGENLHVSLLNLAEGQVRVEGCVTAVEYDTRGRREKTGLLGRLLR